MPIATTEGVPSLVTRFTALEISGSGWPGAIGSSERNEYEMPARLDGRHTQTVSNRLPGHNPVAGAVPVVPSSRVEGFGAEDRAAGSSIDLGTARSIKIVLSAENSGTTMKDLNLYGVGSTPPRAVRLRWRPVLPALLVGLAGCTSGATRPAVSTAGCAEAVVAALPAGLTDAEKHCVASAGIALQCSHLEAWLAGWAKEARDAMGHGDASRDDLAADRLGRQCASTSSESDTLVRCCRLGLADFR